MIFFASLEDEAFLKESTLKGKNPRAPLMCYYFRLQKLQSTITELSTSHKVPDIAMTVIVKLWIIHGFLQIWYVIIELRSCLYLFTEF